MWKTGKIYKNRSGVDYSFHEVGENTVEVRFADFGIGRIGGREGQEKLDSLDLGMVDPSGGPYICLGMKVNGREIVKISDKPNSDDTFLLSLGKEECPGEGKCEDPGCPAYYADPVVDLFENGNLENLMKTYNRFDLEAQIQKCWQITDEIDDLYKLVGDSPDFAGIPSGVEDELMNYLLGIKTIYERKFDTLWIMFDKMIQDEVIR